MTNLLPMQAAILEKPGHFVLEDRPLPDVGPDDVRVRTVACGICTSELDMFEGKATGLSFPRFIGHEVSGYVDAVGSRVTGFSEGDRVAVYAEGQGYAEYVTVPSAWVVPIAAHVPFEHALGEPIACSVNGVRKIGPEIGARVGIVGCGFMGLIMLQVFRAAGAGLLVAIDPRASVRELALRLGATHAVTPDEAPAQVEALSPGGLDVGVEAAGLQATLDLTTKLVRMEGALEVFGFHQGAPRAVDWGYWNWMAFRIVNGHTRSQHVYVEGMRIGLGMLERGALQMAPLVTHRFALDRINEGFEAASAKPEGFVKGVIAFES